LDKREESFLGQDRPEEDEGHGEGGLVERELGKLAVSPDPPPVISQKNLAR